MVMSPLQWEQSLGSEAWAWAGYHHFKNPSNGLTGTLAMVSIFLIQGLQTFYYWKYKVSAKKIPNILSV